MSAPKYAKRRDHSELPQVRALKERGFKVCRTMPVDLLVLKWVSLEQLLTATERRGELYCLTKLLECKTPITKKGTATKRYDQPEQVEFCERFAVPRVLAPMDALLMCGETVTLT